MTVLHPRLAVQRRNSPYPRHLSTSRHRDRHTARRDLGHLPNYHHHHHRTTYRCPVHHPNSHHLRRLPAHRHRPIRTMYPSHSIPQAGSAPGRLLIRREVQCRADFQYQAPPPAEYFRSHPGIESSDGPEMYHPPHRHGMLRRCSNRQLLRQRQAPEHCMRPYRYRALLSTHRRRGHLPEDRPLRARLTDHRRRDRRSAN